MFTVQVAGVPNLTFTKVNDLTHVCVRWSHAYYTFFLTVTNLNPLMLTVANSILAIVMKSCKNRIYSMENTTNNFPSNIL